MGLTPVKASIVYSESDGQEGEKEGQEEESEDISEVLLIPLLFL
jgi:hypothetical protein